ncbi:MAG: hypothetical protein H6853_05730 [Rhodospirillales bacterium]|nr:hypothetical protein [Alphaproteobacteria bacterium]USO03045.1 MAG: hypothetical protein H6853_05730 [Rhodospirillales bacterium]
MKIAGQDITRENVAGMTFAGGYGAIFGSISGAFNGLAEAFKASGSPLGTGLCYTTSAAVGIGLLACFCQFTKDFGAPKSTFLVGSAAAIGGGILGFNVLAANLNEKDVSAPLENAGTGCTEECYESRVEGTVLPPGLALKPC